MPHEQYKVFARHLVPVDMPLGMHCSTPFEPVEYVYFPVTGLISIEALTHSGECVEVAVLGNEGLTGSCGLLAHSMMGHTVNVQSSGTGLRARLPYVREEFARGGLFAQLIHTHMYLQMVQMSQSVLCNRLHPLEQRMARWLLFVADRLHSESLQTTQEILAQKLGSRRSTVTVAAGILQREGLIDYTRGRVRIINRPMLEAKACECYRIVCKAYDTLTANEF